MDHLDTAFSYADVGKHAAKLRELLANKGIRIHPECTLEKLLQSAEAVGIACIAGRRSFSAKELTDVAHAHRITEAVLTFSDSENIIECMRRIAGGNMELSRRVKSQGKDALWELELGLTMRLGGAMVTYLDPPDLVVKLPFGDYPIACKKIYTEGGVEGQIKKGCRQLATYGKPGIIALNIDDLTPADAWLKGPSRASASEFLFQKNMEFIRRNKAAIQKFVKQGKCDGILVSTTVLSDVDDEVTRMNSHTEATLLSFNEVSQEVSGRIYALNVLLQLVHRDKKWTR